MRVFVASAVLAVAVTGCGESGIDVGIGVEPVVYGVDDREEVFAHPDTALRTRAIQSAVAMVPRARIRSSNGFVSLSSATLGQREQLCADQRFADQLAAAFCSGVLIDGDLVMTAGHCIESQSDCDAFSFVFDYYLESEGRLASIEDDDVYRCTRIVVRGKGGSVDPTPDFAVIQLDRPVTSVRQPAPIRPRQEAIIAGDPIAMIGFGTGLPAKIDDGASVTDARTAQLDFLIANLDAFSGHSGSAVFDNRNRLVGMLVAGRGPDYVSREGSGCFEVNTFEEEEADEVVQYVYPVVDALCASGWSTALCGNATCQGADCPPAGWTCNPDWYDNGASCNCTCGIYDPDCDNSSLPVDGCPTSQVCDEVGVCKNAPANSGDTSEGRGRCTVSWHAAPHDISVAWSVFALWAIGFFRARRRAASPRRAPR